ncbi:PAS domain S-box protein [Sinorhizobium sp. CCBAU 05631]|uniref:PAS domain S-box protein n=1 Tax=Sinorhizobium sp. CCBAU 05631 TaxID=794846 RepID=UPI0004ADD2A1|nr:PAS domain S-box protein [Sinorhizobium sp. CCBAU 05631]ASY60842.1 diguanylate cyclase/phosphodiesterase (GGDEF & EAL domains) with PAS/PAC sensor(s) [Sinorhizobium sp. CCBAU 05631]
MGKGAAKEKIIVATMLDIAAHRTGDAINSGCGTLRDDGRRALQAIQESEARFRAIADDAPVMIWVTDENGAATYHSRLWLETTGQLPEEAQGAGWTEAILWQPASRGTCTGIPLSAIHHARGIWT